MKLRELNTKYVLSDGNWIVSPQKLRAIQLEAARDALEEAARVCKRMDQKSRNYFAAMGSAGMPEYNAMDCVEAIRAIPLEQP